MGTVNALYETATLGAGCFWCVEAAFQQVRGITSVASGYAGGTIPNPTYEQVCSGTTGHAEAVQITFNPQVISYAEILDIFWSIHDPTTLNRQGSDVGPQYRSVIFYHNERQKQIAEHKKKKIDNAGIWSNPIVTEIVPYTTFYKAEDYHQNFYKNNPRQPYCVLIIRPKIDKVRKEFHNKLLEP
ncbi:MAG: peptide-methionine (S)-S-oxide reductase MsrA [Desulfobacterota bacterium]|nr:peptide-methionine (S)-S-oxide reductase MsrA [Thermodesulfobacteriota bacterium]